MLLDLIGGISVSSEIKFGSRKWYGICPSHHPLFKYVCKYSINLCTMYVITFC